MALPGGTHLAEQSSPVEELAWKAGRSTLRLRHGSATAILQGEQVVGLFLKGEGTLEYISAFAPEFPLMAFNLKQNKGPEAKIEGKTRVIRVPYTQAALFAFGLEKPGLATPDAPAPKEEYQAHRAFFDRVPGDPLGHLVAWRSLNGSPGPVGRIELGTSERAFQYDLDGTLSQMEALKGLRNGLMGNPNWVAEYAISSQPMEGKTTLFTPSPWRLTDLDLDLLATDKQDISIKAEETLQGVQTTRLLLLDMISSRVDDQLVQHPVRIKSITTSKGDALPFDHRNHKLAILLPTPLQPGETLKLTFQIEGKLLFRHGGDQCWELSIFPWFPQPPMDGHMYAFHSVVRVPKPFVPIMSGETVRRIEEGSYNLLETRSTKPLCWVALSAGKYTIKEFKRKDLTVRLAGYAGLGASSERLAKTALGIIGFYEALLGPFPFKELNLVERNALGNGQAPPGIVWITSEAFDPIGSTVNRIMASQWINQGLAHEIAHQYWGTQVKMASGEDQWLTESFAEYCSALAILAMKGKQEDGYEKIINHWRSRALVAHEAAPIPLANLLAPAENAKEGGRFRQDILYFKGACLLYSLHQQLGDKAFRKFLWLVQSNLGFKNPATTADLLPFLSYVSHKDFAPFLERYFWGTEMPPFAAQILPPL